MRRGMTWVVLALALAVVLCLLPIVHIPDYAITLITQMFILGIAAMGLDIVVGYTGLVSFAQAAFFGIGAYGIAIGTTEMGITNFGVLVIGSVILVGLVGALFGLLALRASGVGFIIVTLALNELVWGLAYQWVSVSGGDNGITGFTRPIIGPLNFTSDYTFYYLAFAFLVISAVLLYLVTRSPFGLALRGIREQPRRMRALGYNIWLYRYIAFIIAAFFGGVGGTLIAYYNVFVSTTTSNLAQSTQFLIMGILGGTGTLFGSLLGSGIIVTLTNLLSNYTQRWELILGAIYVAIVIWAPDGIIGIVRRLRRPPAVVEAKPAAAEPEKEVRTTP
jgi:branched-chain amino acid transport system permease protein